MERFVQQMKDAKDGDMIETEDAIGKNLFMMHGIPLFIPQKMLKEGQTGLEAFNEMKDMTIRDDDVMILAYSKCGTHWIWEIIEMLRCGEIKHQTKPKETRMLEFNIKDGIDDIPSPRTLNSHLPPRFLPQQMTEKRVKCIQAFRNPKDTAVSYYFHLSKMKEGFVGSFDTFVEVFLYGILVYGSYHEYIRRMQKELKERPELPVLALYYEDMKEDPAKAVCDIAAFLGVETSKQFCIEVAEACSFKNMKVADKKKDKGPIELWKEGSGGTFYRKGEIGDWKNHFTVAQSEMFDRVWAEKTKDLNMNFRYS